MKYLSAVWLAFVILCCTAVTEGCVKPAHSPDPDDMDSEVVALVMPNDEGENYVFCTATWISRDEMLTAAHCARAWVEEAKVPAYSTQREAGDVSRDITRTHALDIVAVDETKDLALLRAPKPTGDRVADIALTAPDVGEHIYVVGHPMGMVWTHTEGSVAAYRMMAGPFPIEGGFMQLSAPVWFGNSGGPCFNADGEIVGVSSFIMPRVPLTAFFVDLHTIQRFLLKNMAK